MEQCQFNDILHVQSQHLIFPKIVSKTYTCMDVGDSAYVVMVVDLHNIQTEIRNNQNNNLHRCCSYCSTQLPIIYSTNSPKEQSTHKKTSLSIVLDLQRIPNIIDLYAPIFGTSPRRKYSITILNEKIALGMPLMLALTYCPPHW